MENRRSKNIISSSQTRCKKHPKHQQSPGVCSVCLGERLSQVSTNSSSRRAAVEPYCCSSSSSLSSLSSLSSSSRCSSSEPSPARRHHHHHHHHHHHRVRSDAAGVKWSKSNVFGKSRSMAFVGEGIKNKSAGFWSRLLRPRSQKKNIHGDGGFVGFVHSRTMRERMFATRVY